jgi:hypothetical protein
MLRTLPSGKTSMCLNLSSKAVLCVCVCVCRILGLFEQIKSKKVVRPFQATKA